jgi:1-aminocyclopropane-1-carboxylate deaminase
MIQNLYTSANGVEVDILRLDTIDSLAPGNKWFKLVPNLVAARHANATRLISFGGAYSNHLHALAALGHVKGFETIGCVRADRGDPLTPTLLDAKSWGMTLHYLSRSDYRRRNEREFITEILAQYPNSYLIPEGGANKIGAGGCGKIVDLIPNRGSDYTALVLACGTGTTLAGIASMIADGVRVIGVPVLKAEKFMARDISAMLAVLGADRDNWQLDHRFYGGAYARLPQAVVEHMQTFECHNGILLDPVYTAKASYAVQSMINNQEFPTGSRILLVHTGGLQGRRGFNL